MINLYKIIDDTFVNIWNQVHTRANATWIAQLQQQLSEAIPAYLLCTEAQAVEIRVTQHWLQAMVWQLRVRDIPMSSVGQDNPMNFQFPIKISKDLLTMTHQFSQPAMEVHGAGLVSFFSNSASTLAAFHLLRVQTISRSDRGIPATYCAGTVQPLAVSISDVRSLIH